MELMPLVIQLIAGAVGGNAAGAMLKDKSLGALGNTIAGIIGGGVGGKLLSILLGAPVPGAALDASSLWMILGGFVGGAIVMILVGLVKNISKA